MIVIDGRRFMVGKYQAEVISDVDNYTEDGVKISRGVRVRVEALHDADTPALDLPVARCCIPNTGNNSGEKPRPNVGQKIFVSFEMGDPDYPIWEGGFLEDLDASSGHKKQRIDGDDVKEIKQNKTTTIDGSETRSVKKDQTITVEGKATHAYQEIAEMVVGGKAVTVGRLQRTVQGKDQAEIQGDMIWTILGHQNLCIGGSKSESVSGTMRGLALEQAIIKALNTGGLPTSAAILFEAINGGVKAVAKSLVGVEGSSLNLDPLGATTALKSLASLSIESPVTRIGPTGTAVVPIATLPHVHLAFGVSTAPVTPGAGAPLSILGPAA